MDDSTDALRTLPGYLFPLTAYLTFSTPMIQTPVFVNLLLFTVVQGAREAKRRVASRFLIRERESMTKQTNVQSARRSVSPLLQRFWFIVDLVAAQHLCSWPLNIVQGHYWQKMLRNRCAFVIHLLAWTLLVRWGFKLGTFWLQPHFTNCLGSIIPVWGMH